MNPGTAFGSLLWFIAVLALIPVALWLLRRTPAGGAPAGKLMRVVAVLPLAPNQRVATLEIGRGNARRWLVLGITGQQITTLCELTPQDDAPGAPAVQATAPFAQFLSRLQSRDRDGGHAR
jgi:flagellar protein FliO/FliZ